LRPSDPEPNVCLQLSRVEGRGGSSLAGGWAEIFRGPDFAETAESQGWANRAELAAMPGRLLLWGERPDAYVSLMKCGAFGWVNRS
jgi:hypothetical protein